MVGLAHDLEMQTTAEGVETQDELVLVRKLGVSLIQGDLRQADAGRRSA